MNSTRWVIVDDTNPRITYLPYHQLEAGNTDTPTKRSELSQLLNEDDGTSGQPFNDTLYIPPPGEGYSISFEYEGTDVLIYVTDASGVAYSTDDMDLCSVDGVSMSQEAVTFDTLTHNVPQCASSLQYGHHTVKLSVPPTARFLLDRIEYAPSPEASFENQVIRIDHRHVGLKFGEGWILRRPIVRTKGPKATFEFDFTGISLAWYGVALDGLWRVSSSGTYSLDDGPAQQFDIPGSLEKVRESQKFFETPTLPMGRHTIKVDWNGGKNSAPFTMDYLIVNNGSLADLEAIPPTSDPLEPNPKSDSDMVPSISTVVTEVEIHVVSLTSEGPTHTGLSKRPTNVGVLVGSILAAILAILILLSLCLFFRHRRRKQFIVDPFQIVQPSSTIHASSKQHQSLSESPAVLAGDSPPTPIPRHTSRVQFLTKLFGPTQSPSLVFPVLGLPSPIPFVQHDDSGWRQDDTRSVSTLSGVLPNHQGQIRIPSNPILSSTGVL